MNQCMKKLLENKRDMYGDNCFNRIGSYWEQFFARPFSDTDVKIAMILMKVARLENALKVGAKEGAIDSTKDIIGYAMLILECLEE